MRFSNNTTPGPHSKSTAGRQNQDWSCRSTNHRHRWRDWSWNATLQVSWSGYIQSAVASFVLSEFENSGLFISLLLEVIHVYLQPLW